MLRAQLLRVRGKAEERVDFATGEEFYRPAGLIARDPMQILARIDADMRSYRAKEQVARRSQKCDSDALAFQLGEAASDVVDKQLEAADMHAAEHRQLYAAIEPGDEHRGEVRAEIDLAAGNSLGRVVGRRQAHVSDIGKTLGAQQFLGDVLRRNAYSLEIGNPHSVSFEAGPCGQRLPCAEEPGGASQGRAAHETASCLHNLHSKPPFLLWFMSSARV